MVLTFLVILAVLAYAILAEFEKPPEAEPKIGGSCSGCAQPVESDWLLCPRCRKLLKEHCGRCGQPAATYHRFCPWCGRRREEDG
jgi:hypothetical protein